MPYSRRTFTLIEMLIVIVIIGILATALIPRLQSVQWRARDTKRKTDLKTIYNALEIYKLDFGLYPRPRNNFFTSWTYNVDNEVLSYHPQPWISGLDNYLTSLPVDPINKTWWVGYSVWWIGVQYLPYDTGNYVYDYGIVMLDGKTYDLLAQLENRQDPDRCGVKQYKYRGTVTGDIYSWCGNYSTLIYEYSPGSNSF